MTTSAPQTAAIRAGRTLARSLGAAPELWISGAAFAVYPALRPFSDEVGRAGALAFASPLWLVAHTFGILAFALLGPGLQRLAQVPESRRRRARAGLGLAWVGLGLTLPYYGAEAFGLHAAGEQGLATGNFAGFDVLVGQIRWESGIWFIICGLLALATGTIVLTAVSWPDLPRPQWTLLPLAVSVALYIPQFAASQPVRVAHGLLMTAGCILLAAGLTARRTR